jgi:hypothetical protein
MRALASFIMRSRSQAALVVVLAALLPLLNVISGAAVALITLRQGPREGMLVIVLSAGAAGTLFLLLSGSVVPAMGTAGMVWLPLWLLALVLRYSVSLARTLQLALLLAGVALVGYAASVGDLTVWGRTLLEQVLKPILQQTGMLGDGDAIIGQTLDFLAPLTLGLLFANGLLALLFSLLLGRWWQSLLYNPGGFRAEFHDLRLGQPTALSALAVFGLALLTALPLFVNLALLVMVVFALQGIAIAHGVVDKAALARTWLVGLYLLLLFALPEMLMLLCLLAMSDAWFDYRMRIKPRA